MSKSSVSANFAEQLAQALMLEQVNYVKKQLLNNNTDLTQTQYFGQTFIDHLYQYAEQVLLSDVIQLEQLHAVVRKFCFELYLGGDILEFIGIASHNIYQHLSTHSNQLGQCISDETFESWVFKILELEQIRSALNQHLQHNPHVHQISLQLANHIVEQHTPWLDQLRRLKLNSDSLRARALNFIQDQQHVIELKLEQQLAQALLKHLGEIILLPSDELADICLHLWSTIKRLSLKECFSQVQAIDVEEFFILVYETWKELRQTPMMQDSILNVVDAFYQHFADSDLQALLHAVGLNKQDLYLEAHRFIPPLLQALNDLGLLDGILLSMFGSFYQDSATLALIEAHYPIAE